MQVMTSNVSQVWWEVGVWQVNAPSVPEFSEVSWHPLLSCESFCKGSLYIPEDAFIAMVLHAQQTWVLEPQEHLQSSLQPPGDGYLLGGQEHIWHQPPVAALQMPPMVIWPRVKHVQGFQSACAHRLLHCHISWGTEVLAEGARQLQPG